jgi:hypothetical protein
MPGMAAYTKVNGVDHILNICQSAAISAPTDWTDIPILMSEKRTYETNEIKISSASSNNVEVVIDAVLNEIVIKKCDSDRDFCKAILDLCVGCVKELFNIEINPSSFTFKKGFYHGEYGWDDKTGQPKKSQCKEHTEALVAEMSQLKTSASPKRKPLIEEIVSPVAAQLKTSASPKRKPLIEEIVSPGTFELEEFHDKYVLHLEVNPVNCI